MRANATAQALAAWLNFARGGVGWTELIDSNGDRRPDTAFRVVMAQVEAILLNPGASEAQLEQANVLAERVNAHKPRPINKDGVC